MSLAGTSIQGLQDTNDEEAQELPVEDKINWTSDISEKEKVQNSDLVRHLQQVGTAAACIHRANKTLGAFALLWASVIILGGLVTSLRIEDFYATTALLLAEAIRNVLASITPLLLSSPLYDMSGQAAQRRTKYGTDRQVNNAFWALVLVMAVQLSCIAAGFAVAPWRIHSHSLTARAGIDDVHNANAALKVFYALIIANCVTSSLFWLVELAAHWWLKDQPLVFRNYFHAITLHCLDKGLWLAHSLKFAEFGVVCMAEQHARGVPKYWALKSVRPFMAFLIKGDEGLDVLLKFLFSDDRHWQQAAINLISMWPRKQMVIQSGNIMNKLVSNLRCTLIGRTSAECFTELMSSQDVSPAFFREYLPWTELAVALFSCFKISAISSPDPAFLRAYDSLLDVACKSGVQLIVDAASSSDQILENLENIISSDPENVKRLRMCVWALAVRLSLHAMPHFGRMPGAADSIRSLLTSVNSRKALMDSKHADGAYWYKPDEKKLKEMNELELFQN